jgi:hypothetical protein
VFDGDRGDLRGALLAICCGLGLGDDIGVRALGSAPIDDHGARLRLPASPKFIQPSVLRKGSHHA